MSNTTRNFGDWLQDVIEVTDIDTSHLQGALWSTEERIQALLKNTAEPSNQEINLAVQNIVNDTIIWKQEDQLNQLTTELQSIYNINVKDILEQATFASWFSDSIENSLYENSSYIALSRAFNIDPARIRHFLINHDTPSTREMKSIFTQLMNAVLDSKKQQEKVREFQKISHQEVTLPEPNELLQLLSSYQQYISTQDIKQLLENSGIDIVKITQQAKYKISIENKTRMEKSIKKFIEDPKLQTTLLSLLNI